MFRLVNSILSLKTPINASISSLKHLTNQIGIILTGRTTNRIQIPLMPMLKKIYIKAENVPIGFPTHIFFVLKGLVSARISLCFLVMYTGFLQTWDLKIVLSCLKFTH